MEARATQSRERYIYSGWIWFKLFPSLLSLALFISLSLSGWSGEEYQSGHVEKDNKILAVRSDSPTVPIQGSSSCFGWPARWLLSNQSRSSLTTPSTLIHAAASKGTK